MPRHLKSKSTYFRGVRANIILPVQAVDIKIKYQQPVQATSILNKSITISLV
jgi:hypothetical protein